MKVRIKFAKHGAMKFIGHLDIMRYFQKAIRRAEIDIAYTEGFSPHMVMSFANPLGVGLTSDGEYLDIELRTPISSREALKRLNDVMVEGMEILSFRQVPDEKTSKAMALVAAADYRVAFRPGKEPDLDWQARIGAFLAQDSIKIVKKTKKKEEELEIRPLIFQMYPDGEGVFLQVSSGSACNIKPELVMEAFASFAGFEIEEFALLIHRLEVYAANPAGEGFVSLESLGEDIE
ncbi:MAG: TIGR03936 family radical SAM-associated protein [Eubacteriales bacterium]|nr:TIGR03936 family radical SAM-associated protein [Eubacteriales bacterium]